jgi:hypothetical protein
MSDANETREIDMHRLVCVVRPNVIDFRPARSAAIAPAIGFLLGVLAFIAVVLWLEDLPFMLALALMGGAILLVPFSGMGFVYSVYGANVVVDGTKRTAVWQQGLFGMGVGTEQLVPFEKIDQVEIEEIGHSIDPEGVPDFAEFEVRVLKISGKKLSFGQINVRGDMLDDGLRRARLIGEAVSSMVERPLKEFGGEARKRYRKREESVT